MFDKRSPLLPTTALLAGLAFSFTGCKPASSNSDPQNPTPSNAIQKGLPTLSYTNPGAELINSRIRAGENIQLKFYDVQGNNLAEILDDIKRKGPLAPPDTNRFAAHTLSELGFNAKSNPDGKGSQLVLYSVSFITFPNLKEPQRLSEAALAEWNRFTLELAKHELGHSDLASQALERFTTRASTEANLTETRLRVLHQEALAEVGAADIEYDDRTKHGKSQGAWLKTNIK